MDLQLDDKVALVTGSSRGLGFASARALALEGCRVCVCARGDDGVRGATAQLQSELGASGEDRVVGVTADLSTETGVARAIEGTVQAFGSLDILVNNVGLGRGAGIADTPDEAWQEAFDQTLFPAIRASRLAVPRMRQRGGGVIIVIASIFGREAGGRMTYNAVKAAEISLAKSMARELAADNIRVNSVAPGSILFPGGSWYRRQQENPEWIDAFIERELPFGRFGRPEDVGAVVAFLASPSASWVSGACITVDGCQSRAF